MCVIECSRNDVESVPWGFETGVLKEYLSKFYRDETSALREIIANAITATLQLPPEERKPVVVEIQPNKITVTDFGVGMTIKTFKEIFMWFGRSGNREFEGMQGKFGLGAKAFLMLAGENGYAVIRSKSHETGESFKAILTSNGAEILPENKSERGTTFEIYPEKTLTDDQIDQFAGKVRYYFAFSRVPIILKTPKGTEEIRCPQIKLVEEKPEYQVGLVENAKPYSGGHYDAILVVGDVVVYTSSYESLPVVVRVLVEDGREVEVAPGIKAKTPEPLPNREEYKNDYEFLKLVLTKVKLNHIREKLSFLSSPEETVKTAKSNEVNVNELENLYNSLKYLAQKYPQLTDAVVPPVIRKRLETLLKRVPIYGFHGYHYGNKRTSVVLFDALRTSATIYYTHKRPTAEQEKFLEVKRVSVIVVPQDAQITYLLRLAGIQPLPNLVKDKIIFKTYSASTMELVPKTYEDLLRDLREFPQIVVYCEKKSEIPQDVNHPRVLFVIGPKNGIRKLKATFGDLVVSIDEFKEQLKKLTIVSDGTNVFPLSDAPNDAIVVNSEYWNLVPIANIVTGKRILFALWTPQAHDLLQSLADEIKDEKHKELFNLLFDHDYANLRDHLIEFAYQLLNVPKCKPFEELQERMYEIPAPRIKLNVNLSTVLPISEDACPFHLIGLTVPHLLSHEFDKLRSLPLPPSADPLWWIVALENWDKLPQKAKDEIIQVISDYIKERSDVDFSPLFERYPFLINTKMLVNLL